MAIIVNNKLAEKNTVWKILLRLRIKVRFSKLSRLMGPHFWCTLTFSTASLLRGSCHYFVVVSGTVCWHEDLGKFPNCLNSIPNENLGLKKENKQNFFCKYI